MIKILLFYLTTTQNPISNLREIRSEINNFLSEDYKYKSDLYQKLPHFQIKNFLKTQLFKLIKKLS
jgi:hypothetical protein